MSAKDRGPRPKVDSDAELVTDLRTAFKLRGDRTDSGYRADPTGWRADSTILARLGPALAALIPEARATVVLGPQSRGAVVGAPVASSLRIGLVELRKDPSPAADSDRWLITHTPPDYQDRNLRLGVRRDRLAAGRRILFVDDLIATGGQAIGAQAWSNNRAPPGVALQ